MDCFSFSVFCAWMMKILCERSITDAMSGAFHTRFLTFTSVFFLSNTVFPSLSLPCVPFVCFDLFLFFHQHLRRMIPSEGQIVVFRSVEVHCSADWGESDVLVAFSFSILEFPRPLINPFDIISRTIISQYFFPIFIAPIFFVSSPLIILQR